MPGVNEKGQIFRSLNDTSCLEKTRQGAFEGSRLNVRLVRGGVVANHLKHSQDVGHIESHVFAPRPSHHLHTDRQTLRRGASSNDCTRPFSHDSCILPRHIGSASSSSPCTDHTGYLYVVLYGYWDSVKQSSDVSPCKRGIRFSSLSLGVLRNQLHYRI